MYAQTAGKDVMLLPEATGTESGADITVFRDRPPKYMLTGLAPVGWTAREEMGLS